MSTPRLLTVLVLAAMAGACERIPLDPHAQGTPPRASFSLYDSGPYPAPAQVALTGQLLSYAPGDDGELRFGIASPDPRFADHGDSTVTDLLTGLMWAKDANLDVLRNTWPVALEYAEFLNSNTFAGYSDWRIPNVHEFGSLIDYGRSLPALPAGHPFVNVQDLFGVPHTRHYWTSTPVQTHIGGPTRVTHAIAWSFESGRGESIPQNATWGLYVWPVRGSTLCGGIIQLPRTGWTESVAPGDDGFHAQGAAWPDPRFVDHGDGTVTDRLTGFMWSQNANLMGLRSWGDALSAVAEMNADGGLNGYQDWRLPNARELLSLVDFSRKEPPLPPGHPFIAVQPGYYWASTTNAATTTEAAVVSLEVPSATPFFPKDFPFRVWPVRGDGTSSENLHAGPVCPPPPDEDDDPPADAPPTIQSLVDAVAALADSGTLSRGESRSLLAKLEAAAAQLARGNANAAAGQLRAFQNEVRALVGSRRLDAATGAALIASAERILEGF